MTTYKPAKNAQEQIEYLKTNKKITFNSIHEQQARDILFKYNYINVITPFEPLITEVTRFLGTGFF